MVRSSFSAESSGYKLRGNICRKNVVGLVLWDNRQFPRPQAWGSFKHRLSLPPLSVSLLPKGRFVPAFFAFGDFQKTGNILLFYSKICFAWKILLAWKLLFTWQLDIGQAANKGTLKVSTMSDNSSSAESSIFIIELKYRMFTSIVIEGDMTIWVILRCWGNSSMVEGRFSKWF